ncbi:MAG: hypothetical protein EZS28_015962 [Streblomastix strix]|uniref:Reverse transcriptase domain-containing protein n=1 Tax=Streblomastix strix TaxID=222440 RepID=A0A5J4W0P4_9EUKA|nr:MAG: hypothetical protein EZS28_015962 [Streblomastix strix]
MQSSTIWLQVIYYVFTKALAITICALCSKQFVKIQSYMDDIEILSKSKHPLESSTLKIIQFLRDIRCRISLKKCQTFPNIVFQYLGWIFSSIDMTVSMPHQRKRQMKGKLYE